MLQRLIPLCLVILLAPRAQAGIVITVQDSQINAGGTTYVDVMIESDQVGGDEIAVANFAFNLSPALGGGRVEFTPVQPQDYLDDLEYIFEGNSFAKANLLPVGIVLGTPPRTRFVGGDSTADFANLALPLTTAKVLTRLQLTTVTPLPPNIGDTFELEFDVGSSSFFDADFNPIDINGVASSFGGTITVVPEPVSLSLFVCAAMTMVGLRRRKSLAPASL